MRIMKQFPVVLLLCVVGFTALAQDPQFTIKVESNLVNVLCTVTDRKGRLIPNLTKDDFIIEEDGKKQEIVSFSKENELPLTLALLIDTSGSVREVLPAEKETASALCRDRRGVRVPVPGAHMHYGYEKPDLPRLFHL